MPVCIPQLHTRLYPQLRGVRGVSTDSKTQQSQAAIRDCGCAGEYKLCGSESSGERSGVFMPVCIPQLHTRLYPQLRGVRGVSTDSETHSVLNATTLLCPTVHAPLPEMMLVIASPASD